MRGYRFLVSQPIDHNAVFPLHRPDLPRTEETWLANGSNQRGITAILSEHANAPSTWGLRAVVRRELLETCLQGSRGETRIILGRWDPTVDQFSLNSSKLVLDLERETKRERHARFKPSLVYCPSKHLRIKLFENPERTIITTRSTTRTNSFVPPYIYLRNYPFQTSLVSFSRTNRSMIITTYLDPTSSNRGWHTSWECDLPVSDKPTRSSRPFSSPFPSGSREVDNSPRNSARFSFRFCHRSNAIQRLD